MKDWMKAGIAGAMLASAGVVHADRGQEAAQLEVLRQLEAKLESGYQQCMKTARTTNATEHCMALKWKGADDAVKEAYQAKLARAQEYVKVKGANESAEVPAMLAQSQGLWEQYAEAECNGLYEQSIGGTIRGTVAAECRYRMAIQRLIALNEW